MTHLQTILTDLQALRPSLTAKMRRSICKGLSISQQTLSNYLNRREGKATNTDTAYDIREAARKLIEEFAKNVAA